MSFGNNVVFFSGGLDSTLVALQLLRAQKYVILVNFDSADIGGETQRALEKMRMKKILQKFRTEFGENAFTLKTFTWEGDLIGDKQSSLWVSVFPCACADNDTAYFGIIKNSDFWHYRTDWETAFHAVCKVQKKKVSIKYPLEWKLKHQIKKELKKYGYLDLAIHSGDSLEKNRVNY